MQVTHCCGDKVVNDQGESPSGVKIDNWPDGFPGNFINTEKFPGNIEY